MPRRSGADITFLLDRLDERRNRYLLPSLPLRFLFSYITYPQPLNDLVTAVFKERKSFPVCVCKRKNSITPDSARRKIRIHRESIIAFDKILRTNSRTTFRLLRPPPPAPPSLLTRLPSSRERLPRIIHIYDQTLYQPHLPRIHLIETSVSEAIGCEPRCALSQGGRKHNGPTTRSTLASFLLDIVDRR